MSELKNVKIGKFLLEGGGGGVVGGKAKAERASKWKILMFNQLLMLLHDFSSDFSRLTLGCDMITGIWVEQ